MTQQPDISRLLNHSALSLLIDEPRWTIVNKYPIPESVIDNSNGAISPAFTGEKIPIDARYFIETNRLRGAWKANEECLVTLPELYQALPNASNACFYIQSEYDGVMVIDIEPECPVEEKARLLSLPNILYAERSLSGHGYHLLVELPKNFYDYPDATVKKALKNNKMHWEILLNHWVTFTTDIIDLKPNNTITAPTLEEVWDEVAPNAKIVVKTPIDFQKEKPHIPQESILSSALINVKYSKTVEDFDNDYSRYEFGYAATLYRRLENLLHNQFRSKKIDMNDPNLDSFKAWLLYDALKANLQWRPKHEEFRDNVPWLMYVVLNLLSIQNETKD